MMGRTYSIHEVADRLGLTTAEARRLIEAGDLPAETVAAPYGLAYRVPQAALRSLSRPSPARHWRRLLLRRAMIGIGVLGLALTIPAVLASSNVPAGAVNSPHQSVREDIRTPSSQALASLPSDAARPSDASALSTALSGPAFTGPAMPWLEGSASVEMDAYVTQAAAPPAFGPLDPWWEDPALPQVNTAALVHGGYGAAGSILAGSGIVKSVDVRTRWEIVIPRAGVRAAIVATPVTPAGVLGSPDNPEVVGWWHEGPRPGDSGNVLLDGHRDYTDREGNVGTGAFWLLPDLKPGDSILIRIPNALAIFVYVVQESIAVRWDDPVGVQYFESAGEPLLTLITCQGEFDRDQHNYSQRRIVVAGLQDTVSF